MERQKHHKRWDYSHIENEEEEKDGKMLDGMAIGRGQHLEDRVEEAEGSSSKRWISFKKSLKLVAKK